MKTIVNYYYNLYPNEIIKVRNGYYFFYDEYKYYIVPINRPTEDLDLILEVNLKLQALNNAGYLILQSKEKKIYFEFENKTYILFKVIGVENRELNLIEILTFNNLVKTQKHNLLTKENWKELWSEKIDYFEYQMSVLKREEIIEDSFSYYIGLAENAVSYVSDTMEEEAEKEVELVLSHKRVNYPVLSSKIYNPLNFIFDYEVRDVAEYIKTSFFNNNINWEEIEDFILKRNYSRFMLRMLYARLLYPSYYFDLYEEYINNKKEEDKLKAVIAKSEEYEEFLFDILILIKKINPIPEVEWLMRKKV